MIKKQKYQWAFLLVLLGLGLVAYFLYYSQRRPEFRSGSDTAVEKAPTTLAPQAVPAQDLTINGRKVIGLPRGKTAADLKDYVPANTPSPVWKKAVESSITKQVGGKVKGLNIKQVDSLVWIQDRIPLNVESIIISFVDPNGREISFRAMVDSQSGRVLQTWDQPVMERFDGKKEGGIKLDPRYEN